MTRIRLDRRTVLRLSCGGAATSLVAGCLGVGPGTETGHIQLGAESSGWNGIEPASIKGETNPTLEFETGTTYELAWVNRDGEKHELVITDDDGMELESTTSAEHNGATRTMSFAADPKMVAYHDTYHPESMAGEIRVST